ncbi:hypothetical protein CHS0354_016368 [Potamilus streckersoni]|uniref:C2H2-type domain-containing protein n=1 Tax=Potamilus streckersoni TaxID=2493646 RepID=A0AAE0SWC0_9BIVA|nr:hypothetical protein CHS0354_016368 [Potamilus streckersoni]
MGSADVKGIIYLSANILQIYETIRAKANKDSDAFIEHLLNLHVRWAQRKIGISVAETLARRFSGIEQEMKMNSDSLMEHLISLYNGEFDGVKDEHGDVEDYSQDASSSSSIPESFLSHYRSKEIPYMSRSVTSNPLKSSHCRKDRDQLLKESSHVTDTSTFPSITNDSVLPSIHLSNAAGERSNKSLEHFEMSGEYEEVGTKRRTSEQCHNPVFFGTSFNSAYQPSGKDSETLKQSSDLSVGNDACYSLHSVSHNGTDFPKNMDTLPEDLIIVNIKEEMDASNFELTGVDQGEKVGREKATNSIQQITGVGDNESNNFTLTDSVRFQDLQQSVHVGGKTKTYKCFICQKQFRTLSTYRYHVPTHKTQQGFKCRLCSHIFPCLSLLRFHMRSHTENNTSTSAVHLDDLERDTTVVGSYEPLPGELEWISEDEDQLSVTTDDSKDLEGTVSNLVDNRLDEWKSSGKSASTQNTDRWAVNRFQAMALGPSSSFTDGSIHGMTITDENGMLKIIKDVALSLKHSTPDGFSTLNHQTKVQNCQKKTKTNTSCVCSSCGKIFACRQNLKRHEEVKHNGNYKHICTYCSKGFHKKRSLLEHMQSHAGIKSEQCSKCGRRYSSSETRQRHENQCEGIYKENVCMNGK